MAYKNKRNMYEELARTKKVLSAFSWIIAQPNYQDQKQVRWLAETMPRTPTLRAEIEEGAKLAGPMSPATYNQLAGALYKHALNLIEVLDARGTDSLRYPLNRR